MRERARCEPCPLCCRQSTADGRWSTAVQINSTTVKVDPAGAKSQREWSDRHTAHPVRGYVFIAAAALCWGISASLGRAAFTGRLATGHALPSIGPLILA